MNSSLLDLVRELNTLNDDNLADRVISNNDVQWCLSELQDILEAEQPTITPPNEPLSINQLKDMKGKPVWLEFTEYDEDNEQVNYRGWALVSSEDVYKFSMF